MRLRPLFRLAALAVSSCLAVWAALPARSQDRKSKPIDQTSKPAILKRDVKFVPPPKVAKYKRTGDVVEIELVVSMKEFSFKNASGTFDKVKTRVYGDALCGPEIRVKPGDLLKVRLKNEIPADTPDVEFDPKNPDAPHGFNVTNLHTHGLNVSPEGRSDNVSLEAKPGEHLDLCFDIHDKHVCGTMWYHAHKHGSVAMQLAGGMAGVLIVEGGMDEVDEIKKAKEHVVVFQQVPYDPAEGKITPKYVYATPDQKKEWEDKGELVRHTLVNGVLQPTIEMQPGEVRRVRFVHAGLEEELNLGLAKEEDEPTDDKLVTVYEIAVDGLPLGKKKACKKLLLYPGYRSDVLIQAPGVEGKYLLRNLPVDAAQALGRAARDKEKFLARVVVKGEKKDMQLPDDAKLAPFRLKSVGELPSDKIVNDKTEVTFNSRDPDPKAPTLKPRYWVNDKPYDKSAVPFAAELGTAEEWTISAEAGAHPFHIHVNPFEVVKIDGKAVEKVWRDTLFVTDVEPVTVRMRFERHKGKTVLHCHNLRHEDQGMMANFEIKVGKIKPDASRCKGARKHGLDGVPGARAPAWELPYRGGKKSWSDFAGKPVLLVLSRGEECMHCREQFQKLRENSKALKDVGLTVVAVCPITASKLPARQDFADWLLADDGRQTFRGFGCHDGRALHGTFLIDRTGRVRWQHAGDDPFLAIDSLPAMVNGWK